MQGGSIGRVASSYQIEVVSIVAVIILREPRAAFLVHNNSCRCVGAAAEGCASGHWGSVIISFHYMNFFEERRIANARLSKESHQSKQHGVEHGACS